MTSEPDVSGSEENVLSTVSGRDSDSVLSSTSHSDSECLPSHIASSNSEWTEAEQLVSFICDDTVEYQHSLPSMTQAKEANILAALDYLSKEFRDRCPSDSTSNLKSQVTKVWLENRRQDQTEAYPRKSQWTAKRIGLMSTFRSTLPPRQKRSFPTFCRDLESLKKGKEGNASENDPLYQPTTLKDLFLDTLLTKPQDEQERAKSVEELSKASDQRLKQMIVELLK
ncbi:uncharacterized protein IL334_007503 [Kwoniella shivajii]|uniref:Uncharacterized protein n=1 Tax=Kwoniella shivajii TaxID=564305 RepID=A0ABZ1DAZ5_9TREE|nr:hypothetical protein IL334_007503 [Kwoniella shivajii]